MSRKTIIIILCILLLCLAAFPIKNSIGRLLYRYNNYLPDHLYVDDYPLGGKTLEQAATVLNQLEADKKKKQITIQYDDGSGNTHNRRFTYEQLGYYIDKAQVMKQLNSLMDKNIGFVKRISHYRNIERSGKNIYLPFEIDYDQYIKALEVINNSNLKSPMDAKYEITNGKIKIIPESDGYLYDKDKLYKELLAGRDPASAKLTIKAVKPFITADILRTQGIKELISKFSTKYDAGNIPRASNIKLAAKFIDGTILAPGTTFSFNKVVGERTIEKGFREAGVYINGKVDTGIGGGICQVSTTLYNAVLYADLEVTNRSNHSLTVAYVPLSRDAAVNWGSQDFAFKNNTQRYIYIHSYTSGGTITFELYGTKSGRKIELVSKTLSKNKAPVVYVNDATKLLGQEAVVENGHDGFESQLIKNVYIEGRKILSEVVSKDKYLQETRIVMRGTKIPDAVQALEDDI